MNTKRIWFHTSICFCVLIFVGLFQTQAQEADQEDRLIEVLKSDAPKSEKAITCKRLAVYGTKNAVPELSKLLSDVELTSWARTALEVIPDPSADEALRAAMMNELEGRPLIGVINSIATRRDAKAVEGLVSHLQNADEQVAAAAAVALGQIGGSEAQEALPAFLTSAPDAVRSEAALGCILLAEQLLESGQVEEAAKLYDQVRNADVPQQRVREAIRGLIIARESISLLVEQLQSSDQDRFRLGLHTARELSSEDVTNALVEALEIADPVRQGLIVLSLADRDAETVMPVILHASSSGSPTVRMNAMEVLGRIGDISCVPTLLEAAGNNDAKVAEAAKNALASLADPGVDTVVRQRLSDATGQLRQVLIDVVGLRRIDAIPQLLKAADDSEQNMRAAALAALGSTVGPEDLSQLITRVIDAKYRRDSQAARKALHAASIRMPDRDACAAELTKAMSNSTVDVQCALVEILASVGGKIALETVGQAAADDRAELKDTASESLGKWMTPDAAPVLLQLAQPQADEKYRIRALRGYIRIARQMKLTPAERAEMCELALKTAARDAERLLVLKVLEIHPSVDTLMVAVHAKNIPSIKEQAQQSALTISQQIGNADEVQKLLDQVDFTPADIEILNATYGVAGTAKDVTDILRKNVGKVPIVNLSSSSYNAIFGGDPAPGVVKQLVVEYKINGLPGKTSFAENAMIILPMPAGGQ